MELRYRLLASLLFVMWLVGISAYLAAFYRSTPYIGILGLIICLASWYFAKFMSNILQSGKEEALFTKALLNSIIQIDADPFVVVNVALEVQLANEAAKRSFGAQIVNCSLRECLPCARFIGILERFCSEGFKTTQRNFIIAQDSATYMVVITPYFHDNKLTYMLINFKNLDRELDMERQIRRHNTNLNHALRTPTTSLFNASEILLQDFKSDPNVLEKFLPLVNTEARKLVVLAQNLSCIQDDNSDANSKHPANLVNMIKNIIFRLDDLALSTPFGVTIEEPNFYSASLNVDWGALNVLLTQVLGNTITTPSSGKHICVKFKLVKLPPKPRTSRQSSMRALKISVLDNTRVLSESKRKELVKMLYKVDRMHAKEILTHGLKLDFVEKDTNNKCATFKINSKEGMGCEFIIYLPIITEEKLAA